MAWVTTVYPGEEIIIDGKTIVRIDSKRGIKIRIDSIGDPPRHSIIKQTIGTNAHVAGRK